MHVCSQQGLKLVAVDVMVADGATAGTSRGPESAAPGRSM